MSATFDKQYMIEMRQTQQLKRGEWKAVYINQKCTKRVFGENLWDRHIQQHRKQSTEMIYHSYVIWNGVTQLE